MITWSVQHTTTATITNFDTILQSTSYKIAFPPFFNIDPCEPTNQIALYPFSLLAGWCPHNSLLLQTKKGSNIKGTSHVTRSNTDQLSFGLSCHGLFIMLELFFTCTLFCKNLCYFRLFLLLSHSKNLVISFHPQIVHGHQTSTPPHHLGLVSQQCCCFKTACMTESYSKQVRRERQDRTNAHPCRTCHFLVKSHDGNFVKCCNWW